MVLYTSTWAERKTFCKRCNTRWITGSSFFGGWALTRQVPFNTRLSQIEPGRGSGSPFVMCKFHTPDRYEQLVLWATGILLSDWLLSAVLSCEVLQERQSVDLHGLSDTFLRLSILNIMHTCRPHYTGTLASVGFGKLGGWHGSKNWWYQSEYFFRCAVLLHVTVWWYAFDDHRVGCSCNTIDFAWVLLLWHESCWEVHGLKIQLETGH